MVLVVTSDQHPSEMQKAGGRGPAFSRQSHGKTVMAWAVSTQERKKPAQAGATTDPEGSLVWGLPLHWG